MSESAPNTHIELGIRISDSTLPTLCWDDIPAAAFSAENIPIFANWIHTLAENSGILSQLHPGLTVQLQSLHRTDIEANGRMDLPDELDFFGVEKNAITWLRETPLFHTLLRRSEAIIHNSRYTDDPSIFDAFDLVCDALRPFVPARVESFSLNGIRVPVPTDVLIRTGKEWEHVHRKVLDSDEKISILTVPDPSSRNFESLSEISGIFLNDSELAFTRPSETTKDLQDVLIHDKKKPIVYLAYVERYVTNCHIGLQSIAAFTTWAQSHMETQPIAELLLQQANIYIQNELSNLSTHRVSVDEEGILHFLSQYPLPYIEIPSRYGRATGYVNLKEHVRILREAPTTQRSDEQWEEEITQVLWHPFTSRR